MRARTDQFRVISRRAVAMWLLGFVAVGSVIVLLSARLIEARFDELLALADSDADAAARQALSVVRLVMTPMLFALAALAVYLGRSGRQMVKTRCSPPPGSWVLEGQQVRTGSRAVRVGWAHVLIGFLLLACAGYGIHFSWIALPRLLLR